VTTNGLPELYPFQPGDRFDGMRRTLNRHVDTINRLTGTPRPPRQVSRSRPAAVAVAAATEVFTVVAIPDGLPWDVVRCTRGDDRDAPGEDTWVALPYLLRRTPFDGQVRGGFRYTYTANTSRQSDVFPADPADDTEFQVIGWEYLPGDTIIAARLASPIDVPSAGPVIWEDVNNDARAWLAVVGTP